MGKKDKKKKKPPAAASIAAPAASADEPAVAEAEAEPVDPAPAEDSSSDSSRDDESGTTGESEEPRDGAPSQPRPPAVEDADAPADRDEDARSSEQLAMELARLRARCLSLEDEAEAASSAHAEALRSLRAEKDALAQSHLAELARARESSDAHASSAKSELVSMQAMSSAQRAKIDALTDTVSELEEHIERFERERDSTRTAATAEAVALALAAADAKHEEALRAAVDAGREALRRAYVVHAAAKAQWAAEKIGLVEQRGDAVRAEIAEAARIARYARAAVGSGSDVTQSGKFFPLTEEDEDEALLSPGAALRALFAATTPSRSRAALAAAEADAKRERDVASASANDAAAAAADAGEARTPGKQHERTEPAVPSRGEDERVLDESNESGSTSSSSSSTGSDESGSASDETSAPNEKDSSPREEKEVAGGRSPRSPRSPPRSVGGELADLLDDAMEDEISASVARGYCVDNETGAVIVGASAIVENVMAKYRGDASESSRRKLSPLFSPSNAGAPNAVVTGDVFARAAAGQGPAFERAMREANGGKRGALFGSEDSAFGDKRYVSQSDVFALRLEREQTRNERATLLAELQRCRAELSLAKLEARSEKKRQEAIDFTTSSYEKEEEACVRRLALAADVRAREAEASLKEARKKTVSPSALRAVLAELGELRARLARVREAQETSARLVAPTVASALACLRLSGT
jgi:hypothetical protein